MEWMSSQEDMEPVLRLGNLTRSDGSAILSRADTTIQVAIFGPGDVVIHKELPDRATVEVVLKCASKSRESEFAMVLIVINIVISISFIRSTGGQGQEGLYSVCV